MTQREQVYKRSMCGNMVEVVRAKAGTLVCCGINMDLQDENTTDAAQEKHVPVIKKIDGGFKVKVGEVDHPMEDEHFIEWIEIIAGELVERKYLKPGEAPEAEFKTDADSVSARAFCNLHGLWKS